MPNPISGGGRILIMIQLRFASRKSILLVLAGILLLALLALTWRIISLQKEASEIVAEKVLKLRYCGANPDELCILSFGRDAEENLAVSLFVPDRKFPDFYLKIKRKTGESVYECEKNKEVSTSVFCYGGMVNLQEKMEIDLYSKGDEHLLAQGNLTLNAILLSTQSQGVGMPTPAPTLAGATAETLTLTAETSIATETSTPESSYPNPSYPNPSYP